MVQETLKKIEKTVRDAPQASADTKEELLGLLGELRAELEVLERTHADEARHIASITEQAARESTRPPSGGHSGGPSREPSGAGLSEAVVQFEATHPRIGSLVRAICDSLAAMGI